MARNLLTVSRDKAVTQRPGALFKTELPDAEIDDFLHWDKPLSEQPEKVRKALMDLKVLSPEHQRYRDYSDQMEAIANRPSSELSGSTLTKEWDRLNAERSSLGDAVNFATLPNGERMPISKRGESLYRAFAEASAGDHAAATKALRKAGIRGVRYLDNASRNAGEGSYNYVVFDDADIRILDREGKAALKMMMGAGAAAGGGLTIAEALKAKRAKANRPGR
jgi:hypothetical protein